ncbi:DUF6037 family protein [Sebaldella termitidis]|uniref:DUF6037 family protein n=1 Tax=Sebaldella termitidis TaxID=826 RepID=UPI003EBCCD02
MANIFNNLKLLKHDMLTKGWVIDSFYFSFKEQTYIVLVKLFDENEERPEYASLKLEFLKEEDFTNSLLIYANSKDLFFDVKLFRKYFDIEFSEMGNIIKQFKEHFAKFIPIEVKEDKKESQKNAMISSLSESDSEDPRKKYCFSVRRNPKKNNGELGQRSDYNDNKTRLLRPSLYARLSADTNLSFRYSIDCNDEKSDEAIIANWTQNNKGF